MGRGTRLALGTLAALLIFAAFVCWLVAIWSTGPDAPNRWAGTGFLAIMLGLLLGGVAVAP